MRRRTVAPGGVERLSGEPTPAEAILKTPYVVEFLGLPDFPELHESALEQAIIDNLQSFVLVLGKGFSFVSRQKHIRFDDDDCYIPWNPVRLEQRVGRIHRYGQEKDCLIFNFVARNTREGRVLQTLIERLKEIRDDLGSDQVFDVVGEVFPSKLLEKLLRAMYARQVDEHQIQDRIVRDVSPDRFRSITDSTLEGLAKKELNLSAIVGK